jgi:hypothetical protein
MSDSYSPPWGVGGKTSGGWGVGGKTSGGWGVGGKTFGGLGWSYTPCSSSDS